MTWFDDDWGWSFPGWYANCAVPIFLHDCVTEMLNCLWGLKLNFPNGYHHYTSGPKTYTLYRTDYDAQGRNTCKFLNKYGGPACTDPEAARANACKKIKKIPGIEKINGRPLDQCMDVIPEVNKHF